MTISPSPTKSKPLEPMAETRLLLTGISWQTFERLLAETGDQRHQRFTYRNGMLEIMVPSPAHEEPTRLFEHFAGVLVDALGLELLSLGSLTMRHPSQQQGLEPDCCFYIQNEAVVRGVETLDFEVHPPPDLVVEVDNTSGSLDKFPIYVSLKIPEIWRLAQGRLLIYSLNQPGTGYDVTPDSQVFPGIPIQQIPDFIQRAKKEGQRAAVHAFRQWIQQILQGN